MKQLRRTALARILISALVVLGLLTGCANSADQGLTGEQNINRIVITDTPGQTEQTRTETAEVAVPDDEPVPEETSRSPAYSHSEASSAVPGIPEGKLEVHFIDVGQADAILIKQGSSAMMVDAGNNADADLVVRYLKDQEIEKLDYVIGTHPHEDHIGGLDAIINEFRVDKVIMPRAVATTRTYEDVLSAIQGKGLKITAPVPGTKYSLGSAGFTILAPNGSFYEDLNNYSVVIKLDFGSTSFLLTGDAEALSEQEMVDNGHPLKSDVLKVGHHGSSTSTSEKFLEAVDPKYAVISVGQGNSYGHPDQSVVERLKKHGVTIYRTDENGTIKAVSDGTTLEFITEKAGDSTKTTKTPPPASTPGPATPAPSKSPPSQAQNPGGVRIISVDLVNETVTIKNTSARDVDISGWVLHSVKGDQKFTFPQGTIIKARATLTVASGDASGDIKWTNKNIWNNDGDPARLIDSNGNIVSEY